MGGESRYEIHQNAYIKLVLHAVKHKTSAVNGVLLGRLSDSDSPNIIVEIVDSVPLFHSSIGVLAPLEISLLMIEEYYRSQELSIVGFFIGNERFDDAELDNAAKNIGDHVSRYFPQAALLLLDNKNLEVLPDGKDGSLVMQLYTKDSSRGWRPVGSDENKRLTAKEPAANIMLMDYISSQKWKDIVDFDDHLDDTSKDWLNSNLFK